MKKSDKTGKLLSTRMREMGMTLLSWNITDNTFICFAVLFFIAEISLVCAIYVTFATPLFHYQPFLSIATYFESTNTDAGRAFGGLYILFSLSNAVLYTPFFFVASKYDELRKRMLNDLPKRKTSIADYDGYLSLALPASVFTFPSLLAWTIAHFTPIKNWHPILQASLFLFGTAKQSEFITIMVLYILFLVPLLFGSGVFFAVYMEE